MATLANTAWDAVPLHGKVLTQEPVPQPAEGVVVASATYVVTDHTTGVLIVPRKDQVFATWPLAADGSLPAGAALPAVDDPDITPQGWVVKLEVLLTNAESFTLYVQPKLADAVAGIDLSNLVPNRVVGDSVPTMRDVVGGFATWLDRHHLKGTDGASVAFAEWADATHLRSPAGASWIVPQKVSDLPAPDVSVSWGGQLLRDLASPIAGDDAANKSYVDSRTGGTANTDYGGYRITNLGDPINDQDAVTKAWAVNNLGGWSAKVPVTFRTSFRSTYNGTYTYYYRTRAHSSLPVLSVQRNSDGSLVRLSGAFCYEIYGATNIFFSSFNQDYQGGTSDPLDGTAGLFLIPAGYRPPLLGTSDRRGMIVPLLRKTMSGKSSATVGSLASPPGVFFGRTDGYTVGGPDPTTLSRAGTSFTVYLPGGSTWSDTIIGGVGIRADGTAVLAAPAQYYFFPDTDDSTAGQYGFHSISGNNSAGNALCITYMMDVTFPTMS